MVELEAIHLLLPRSDTTVLVEAVVLTIAFGGALYAVRRLPEWRIFVIGLWVLTLAVIAFRAAH
ncbi:MAG TPA: hypothetical protein VNF50_04210 [Acidimicrobiales bacterium]|nr:hypothetical protein [Acidimicrobiales bacterium]